MGDMKWYAIQTHSNFENKAKASLIEKARQAGLSDHLGEILVPTENVVEVRKGEKAQREKKLLPGYMLAELNLTPQMWHAVKTASHISGFVGNDRDPAPVPPHEVERLRGQMEEGAKTVKPVVSFQVGDQVKVIDGPFKNFTGKVEEVNPEKARVRVLVSIFGRATPLELEFTQVEVTS